jgi:hypothetical protein
MKTSSPVQQVECRRFCLCRGSLHAAAVRLSPSILRALTAIAAVGCLGGAIANLVFLDATLPLPPIGPASLPVDAVTRADARFAALRSVLAARDIKGKIGYLTDFPSEQLAGTPRGIERYFQAQFALAPLVLAVDGRETWIVTDFERPESRQRLPAGWALAAECGPGISLLRRNP